MNKAEPPDPPDPLDPRTPWDACGGFAASGEDVTSCHVLGVGRVPRRWKEKADARRWAYPGGVSLRFTPPGFARSLLDVATIKGRGCAPSILTRSVLGFACAPRAASGRSLDGMKDGAG